MSNSIIIDSESLRMTVEALETLNPGRASAESIRRQIERSIHESANTYVSTCGWVAFTWVDNHTLKTHVKVAVEPYGVLKYLKEQRA